jgi:hypothetical protein
MWPNGNYLKSLFYESYLLIFGSHCRNVRFITTADLIKYPWNMCANHLLSISVVDRSSTGAPRGFEWNDYVKLSTVRSVSRCALIKGVPQLKEP